MAERRQSNPSTSPHPLAGSAASPVDELRLLIEREARMAEREQAMLARRGALPPAGAAESDAAVEWMEPLRARERALELRGEALLAWGVALERVTATPIATAGDEVFWDSLADHLGVVLAHELPELGTTDVTDVVARALMAVSGKPRSRPPSVVPPALSPEPAPRTLPTAIAEEAELLAGVGGADGDEEVLEEPPSMVSFMRALDDVLPPDDAELDTSAPVELVSAPAVSAAPPAEWPAFDAAEEAELETPVPVEPASEPAASAAPSPEWLAFDAANVAELESSAPVEPAPADADESPVVDEFASFAAFSDELNSVIEKTVDSVVRSAPCAAASEVVEPPASVEVIEVEVGPARPDLSDAEREMALRMTEEVQLSADDIGGGFAGGRPGREAFAFEPAAVPPESPVPEAFAFEPAAVPPESPVPEAFPSSEVKTVAPEQEPNPDDPFADLAAELENFEPGLAGSPDDQDLPLEPIPGYDLKVLESSLPSPVGPPPPLARLPSEPPVPAHLPSEPPRPAAPVSAESATMFRPTLGRVDRASYPALPAQRAARNNDRSAATFAALAAELDVGGIDPWRDLDISDLRTAGHPGPLPTPAPRLRPAVVPERIRGQRGHRATLAVKVGVEWKTTFFTGFSGNISKGGVFVATHQSLPIGARAELFFEMPDGHAVSVAATVQWGRDVDQAALDGSPPGLGFSFVSLTPDDAFILERYIAAHAESVLADEPSFSDRT